MIPREAIRWAPPPTDPREADRRARRAGADLRLVSEGPQKLLAPAFGLSAQRISQMVHGDPTGVTARLYEALDELVERARRDHRINPGAIIAGAMVHLTSRLVGWTDTDLVSWLRESCRWETITEAREDVDEMDMLLALERADDDPEALTDVLRRWDENALREIGWQVAALTAGRELLRRKEVAHV